MHGLQLLDKHSRFAPYIKASALQQLHIFVMIHACTLYFIFLVHHGIIIAQYTWHVYLSGWGIEVA